MTIDWVNIISAVGFPIGLVLLGVNLFAKHVPTVLAECREKQNKLTNEGD